MNISNYIKAGYGCLFVETNEIKRASASIVVDAPFKKAKWNIVEGLQKESSAIADEMDQMEVLNTAKNLQQTAVILENFDFMMANDAVILYQNLLNVYKELASNQVCLVIVGCDIKKIPTILKELVPIIQFDLPSRDDIRTIAYEIAEAGKEAFMHKKATAVANEEIIEPDITINDDVIEACCGMSQEEIENVLSLSMILHRKFDLRTIIDRKRQIIRATGFMDFMNPEPIENLGGLQNLKDYVMKRKEAFEEGSNKPKLRSILIVGFPGTGKSLTTKCISSIFNWPAINLDIGSLKGGLVGDTERNTRIACKTIDAFGKCIVCLDEIEKAFAGNNKGSSSGDSGVSAGMLGHFLTWMQERTSEGILIATANDLDKLPPEFLRAGRWDTIFFVDLPNRQEIKIILEIMNRRYQASMPTNDIFIDRLVKEGWTGAEIEQLAKDSHFDDIDEALNNIPLLSTIRKNEMNAIREKAKLYRKASASDNMKSIKASHKIPRRKLSIGTSSEDK